MRQTLIAGNWKMHNTLVEARALVSGIVSGLQQLPDPQASSCVNAPESSAAPNDRVDDQTCQCRTSGGVEVLICPPCQLLFPMAKAVAGTPIMMGAQNAHEEVSGAFTGEVSVPMLAETGCTHIIIGHSERRHIFGETGARLAKKVRAVTAAGLTGVYCVGETLEERQSGRTESVVGGQLDEAIATDVPADRLVVAYEPVWAIGTGQTATPEQAQEVHRFIRGRIGSIYDASTAEKVRTLYGGSVKPGNAAGLLSQPDIDGALVGGACLVADDFVAIIAAARAV